MDWSWHKFDSTYSALLYLLCWFRYPTSGSPSFCRSLLYLLWLSLLRWSGKQVTSTSQLDLLNMLKLKLSNGSLRNISYIKQLAIRCSPGERTWCQTGDSAPSPWCVHATAAGDTLLLCPNLWATVGIMRRKSSHVRRKSSHVRRNLLMWEEIFSCEK